MAEIDIGLLTLWNSICKLNDSSKLVTFAVAGPPRVVSVIVG